MPPSAKAPLSITRTLLIAAPPARVMTAFFNGDDLTGWWQASRSVTVARPLGTYAVQWEPTEFADEVLGKLGGTLHGTVIDFRSGASFFLADAYWQPPEGDPIGPMALEIHCRPHGNGRQTMVTVKQSAEDHGPRWKRYFDISGRGWDGALQELKGFMDREAERTKRQ